MGLLSITGAPTRYAIQDMKEILSPSDSLHFDPEEAARQAAEVVLPQTPASNSYKDTVYATLTKNGQVIASVDTRGFLKTSNGLALPSDLVSDGQGTSLAQTRIQQIKNMYGGNISYAQCETTKNSLVSAATLVLAQQLGQ